MDFSKVKLIVTDMDGTLLNSQHEVSNQFLHQFQELMQKRIHFVAASGRQYQSILHKLHSIKDEITIVAENGAIIQFGDETKVLLELSPQDIQKCLSLIRPISGAFPVLCGRKSAYVDTKDADFLTKLRQFYAEVTEVDDLTKVEDDAFVKIAVFHFESSENYIFPNLSGIENDFQVIVSGQNWLDISHPSANKAFALRQIQSALKILPEETMAFGDYNNDIEMLKIAKYSFAMQNAHPKVKQVASFSTASNDDFGVELILEQLLA